MLEWAGISFGERDTYLLKQAIKRLTDMSGATKIKFAAKIYGTLQDYWVLSGYLADEGGPGLGEGTEARGEGINSLVYWAANDLLGDWIQLPDCMP